MNRIRHFLERGSEDNQLRAIYQLSKCSKGDSDAIQLLLETLSSKIPNLFEILMLTQQQQDAIDDKIFDIKTGLKNISDKL